MSKSILIILTISILYSCNNSKNQKIEFQTNRDNKQTRKVVPLNVEITDLLENQIPETIEIKGDLLIAKSWKDNNGENLLVITRKGPLEETEYEAEFSGDERYIEIYAEQYLRKKEEFKLLWDIYDSERHCPFDLWMECLPNSIQITDLDNDGITETTIAYSLTCRSDLSPSRMKLIIHENGNKMALQGSMILEIDKKRIKDDFEYDLSKVDTTGLDEVERIYETYGRYSDSNDFIEKPSIFLNFARKSWKSLIFER